MNRISKDLKKDAEKLLPDERLKEDIKGRLFPAPERKRASSRRGLTFALSAVACVLVIAIALGVIFSLPSGDSPNISAGNRTDTLFLIDINPSFEIIADKDGTVTAVTGVNSDARIVLLGKNYNGGSVYDVCTDIISTSVRLGYVTATNNLVNILAYNEDGTVSSEYLEKLTADIKQTAALTSSLGLRLRAVYIGGGTPSILDEKQTERLLGAVSESIGGTGVTEFTYESGRPDTTTVEKLKIAKANGVNRISINPQSTSDFVLKEIGRNHTAAQFFSAAGAAFDVGFDCINADLIAGLPGDDGESFAKSLEDVIELGFQNITVHTLSIKNASAIRFSRSGIYDPEGVFARECVSHSFGRLLGSGYGPYYFYRQKNIIGNAENTGYSLNGKEGIYNVLMMEEASSVFACGAGAITKLVSPDGSVIKRMAHPKYPFEYLSSDDTVGAEAVRKFYGGHFE